MGLVIGAKHGLAKSAIIPFSFRSAQGVRCDDKQEENSGLGPMTKNLISQYHVSGKNTDGSEIHAKLVQVTRYVAVIEIYNPDLVLRASQTLTDLKISVDDIPLYSGRGVVASVI